jgi:hypothetical protein
MKSINPLIEMKSINWDEIDPLKIISQDRAVVKSKHKLISWKRDAKLSFEIIFLENQEPILRLRNLQLQRQRCM